MTSINKVYAATLAHYHVVADPAQVRDPSRKGTVERAIGHTQATALKGRRFESIEAQNELLAHWLKNGVKRIHGTERRQVQATFEKERGHLDAPPQAGLTSSMQPWELCRVSLTCVKFVINLDLSFCTKGNMKFNKFATAAVAVLALSAQSVMAQPTPEAPNGVQTGTSATPGTGTGAATTTGNTAGASVATSSAVGGLAASTIALGAIAAAVVISAASDGGAATATATASSN